MGLAVDLGRAVVQHQDHFAAVVVATFEEHSFDSLVESFFAAVPSHSKAFVADSADLAAALSAESNYLNSNVFKKLVDFCLIISKPSINEFFSLCTFIKIRVRIQHIPAYSFALSCLRDQHRQCSCPFVAVAASENH